MFTYCNNNPVIKKDPDGESPLLIAAVGGAVGGAFVGLFYSIRNDLSLEDTMTTIFGGAIAGGFGAAAGMFTGLPQVGCVLLAAGTSGFTAEATDGEFAIGFTVGLAATLLGTKIPIQSYPSSDLFWGNAVATVATGFPAEIVSQGMHQDYYELREILSDPARPSAGGGSSVPLGLRGMGTGAG